MALVRPWAGTYNAGIVYEPPVVEPAPPEGGASTSKGAFRRLLRVLGELVQTLLIAGVLFVGVNLLTARIRVDGNSMEPSLHDGEFVVVNRLAYLGKEPQRGDIVVFRFPLDPNRRFIKRVVGLPGDTVAARDGIIYVNGVPMDEPYTSARPRYSGKWEVGEGELFVLGDNRNNSSDSQNWGNLDQEELVGKAVLVYWPPSEVGAIPHYDLAVAAEE